MQPDTYHEIPSSQTHRMRVLWDSSGVSHWERLLLLLLWDCERLEEIRYSRQLELTHSLTHSTHVCWELHRKINWWSVLNYWKQRHVGLRKSFLGLVITDLPEGGARPHVFGWVGGWVWGQKGWEWENRSRAIFISQLMGCCLQLNAIIDCFVDCWDNYCHRPCP